MPGRTITGTGRTTVWAGAHDQRLFWHRDPDVLAGAWAATLSRALCRARSADRDPRAAGNPRFAATPARWLSCSNGPSNTVRHYWRTGTYAASW